MKNLYEPAALEEVKTRMAQLKPDSQRLWGKMNPAQALAHCSVAMEMATGKNRPPRILLGRLLGAIGEEGGDPERETNAPQFAHREERNRDR
jgi:hypothetical protein